ncbi:MAG: thioredoxin fold domain-containing protein [Elusimicrobiota bacterium]
MIPFFAVLAVAPAFAEDASLLKNRPETALVGEVIELRPAAGHHFNVEAPQKCGGERPLELISRRVRCQMKNPGKIPVLVSVCDDALTFCRQERFEIKVTGVARAAAKASPMVSAPRENRRAPAGFLDNVPSEAQRRAKKEGKLLFIDFYGIWCPPCNDLEEHAYPTPEFRAAAANFVTLGLDADAPVSFDWKARFKVGGYPTLIVADADLHEIGRLVGFRSGPALAKFMAQASARRGEPVETAARLVAAGGPDATEERRLRVAQWEADRGELEQAEAILKGLTGAPARKALLEARRERARLQEDAAAGLAALKELVKSFPDDAEYSDWLSALADADQNAARELQEALRRSVDRWSADPAAGEAGYDPGDLYYNLASVLDAVGSTEAAKAVWSKVADAYAAQAAKSPLAVPRAANFGRGEALMKAGRKDEAKALYESLVKAYPGEFTFNYDYATQLSDEDPAAAYPYAVKAAEAGYGDNWLRAVRLKASLELKLGRPADAAKTVDEALNSAAPPKSAEVRTYRYLAALRALRRQIADAEKKK